VRREVVELDKAGMDKRRRLDSELPANSLCKLGCFSADYYSEPSELRNNFLQGKFAGNNSISSATLLCRHRCDLDQKTTRQVLKMDLATTCSKYSFCAWRGRTVKIIEQFNDWGRDVVYIMLTCRACTFQICRLAL
jgi:hypothetical protein